MHRVEVVEEADLAASIAERVGRGPSGAGIAGAGIGVVSTTNVFSDSLIFLQPQAAAAVASGFGQDFVVKSINPGVSFTFGTADEIGPGGSTVVMWMIVHQQ